MIIYTPNNFKTQLKQNYEKYINKYMMYDQKKNIFSFPAALTLFLGANIKSTDFIDAIKK